MVKNFQNNDKVKTKIKKQKIEQEQEEDDQEFTQDANDEQQIVQTKNQSIENAPKKHKKIKKEHQKIEQQNQSEDEQNPDDQKNQQTLELEEQQHQDAGVSQQRANFFSLDKFDQLEICKPTKDAINTMKFEYMTHIQSRTIPHLLKGRDVLGAAKTGSGKTLSFLIPAIEMLYKARFTQAQGTGILIITPTRELAQQIYDVAKELLQFHSKTLGILIGGTNRKQEAIKLKVGLNIIVATPGRLLDHLQNTEGFVFHNLLGLVIDEADAILKIGFEEELTQILKIIPKDRQTILFSATQTKKIDELARLSLNLPIYIGVDDIADTPTVDGLEQGFVYVESDKRFRLLFTFLQKQKNKKVMVFFSSCNSVKFHADLLNYVDISVLEIHGKQKQQKRLNTFYEFSNAEKGILLCTDVAARGLDIPKVDWIVQFDPPDDTKEYIHRVGRTCRGANSNGNALLFLLPEEKEYLKYLKASKVNLNEYEFPESKLANVQEQFDKLIERNYFLNKSAAEAFKSYLHAYASHNLKDIFDVANLDLQLVGRAFGFKIPPRVNLNVKLSSRTVRKNKVQMLENKKIGFKSGFQERDKKLLQKNTGDSRQFSR